MHRRLILVFAIVAAFFVSSPSAEAGGHRHGWHHMHRGHHHRSYVRYRTYRPHHHWRHFRYRGYGHARYRHARHHGYRSWYGTHRYAYHSMRHRAYGWTWYRQRRETSIETPHVTSGGGSGLASWYGGRGGGFTAAHRSYPFGTQVEVTNQETGRSVVVRINDRGPFIRGRVIDLSHSAARAIGVTGVSRVRLRRL